MSKVSISQPTDFKHLVHVDKELKWEFDDSVPPEQIFKIKRTIGRGGFGSVYELVHVPSGLSLAGKVVNQEIMTRQARAALFAEIDILKKISTPYTIQYYGNITFGHDPMILMEYCNRGSLRDMIDYRDLCLTEKQAAIVIKDLLIGLQILHSKYKVLHRDIKAANILLNSDGTIRVTDFGVSRKFEQSEETISSIGTPYWMAPEVINGIKYSYPADIWSVGATAVELVEGAPPYCELQPMAAMMQISSRGFPGFRAPRSVSNEFKDFIAHTMSRDPKKRSNILALIKHPWLADVDKLDRAEIMKPLTDTLIDADKLNELIGVESSTSKWITTARKTLRAK